MISPVAAVRCVPFDDTSLRHNEWGKVETCSCVDGTCVKLPSQEHAPFAMAKGARSMTKTKVNVIGLRLNYLTIVT